jgi:hypothetical protein
MSTCQALHVQFKQQAEVCSLGTGDVASQTSEITTSAVTIHPAHQPSIPAHRPGTPLPSRQERFPRQQKLIAQAHPPSTRGHGPSPTLPSRTRKLPSPTCSRISLVLTIDTLPWYHSTLLQNSDAMARMHPCLRLSPWRCRS